MRAPYPHEGEERAGVRGRTVTGCGQSHPGTPRNRGKGLPPGQAGFGSGERQAAAGGSGAVAEPPALAGKESGEAAQAACLTDTVSRMQKDLIVV